ncbi:MAG TPA: hypothetical protein VL096_08655, partial [Pirellulaceae bacterium]|nr:hypothetical protein [Pirellulaceae bacterium]
VNGRKICGILVEVPPVRPARLVIGIGINVNNSLAEAPVELLQRATSMIDIAGQPFDREAICSALLDALFAELTQLPLTAGAFLQRWPQRCLLTGKQVTIDCTTREVRGVCEGLDSQGALLVRTPQGSERLFAGVVKHWDG